MEAALRMEGIPALDLWEVILEVFGKQSAPSGRKPLQELTQQPYFGKDPVLNALLNVDYVPPSLPPNRRQGKLVILEDNDAVIKMTIKTRSPSMRHVARVHRVDLDWLFERISTDEALGMKYINTKDQLADILTKGSFSQETWKVLLKLLQIGPSYGKRATTTQGDIPKMMPAKESAQAQRIK